MKHLIHTAADVGRAVENLDKVCGHVDRTLSEALQSGGAYLEALKHLLILEANCHNISQGGEAEDIMVAAAEFATDLRDRFHYGERQPDILHSQLLRLSGRIVRDALNKLSEEC